MSNYCGFSKTKCKYCGDDGECLFYSMGSGNEEDKPCHNEEVEE